MSALLRTDVLGNLATFAADGRTIEIAAVSSDDLARRIVRVATSVGEIGLRFEGAERLRDGDVVYADPTRVIAVRVQPDDVLVFRPPTIATAIRLAHALGNRHLPIQTDGEAIVVRFDPLLDALADEHGVPVARERRVAFEPFRHPHAPHRHD